MAWIYNGALLTIMAASSLDFHGGLFLPRTEKHKCVALPYQDVRGNTSLSIFASLNLPGYETVVEGGPLFKQAWVFQERLVSKRKLIYGRDQIYWNCAGTIVSEYYDRMTGERQHAVNSHLCVFADPASHTHTYKTIDAWYQLWCNLVETYSVCSLTFNINELPALGGIARTFAQMSAHTYVAGLWREQMPMSLLWHLKNPMSREAVWQYSAPSWSWASVQQPCFFGFTITDEKTESEIVGVDIELAGTDAYGKVLASSSITVRGKMRTS